MQTSPTQGKAPGYAVLGEGTELHVATKNRASASTHANDVLVPQPGFVKLTPAAEGTPSAVSSILTVHPKFAMKMSWTEGLKLGVVIVSHVALLDSMPLSLLRHMAAVATIKLHDSVSEGNAAVCGIDPSQASSVGSVFCFPDPPDTVSMTIGEFLEKGIPKIGAPPELNVIATFSAESQVPADAIVHSVETLRQAHGDVPKRLQTQLSKLTESPSSTIGLQNVLLCGGQGAGKTSIACSVATSVVGLFVRYISCAGGSSNADLVAALHRAATVCMLNAPSVLILDHLDTIAPAQADGGVQAISNYTKGLLQALLQPVLLSSHMANGSFVVVGICTSRESVHESIRGAPHFAQILKVEPLTRDSRLTILRQELRDVLPVKRPDETLCDYEGRKRDFEKTCVSATENYTPLDLTRMCTRLRAHLTQQDTSSAAEIIKSVTEQFTPLAHAGIQFLRPSNAVKFQWSDIGGLSEAKKVLHDTLILPLKHPQLFSKLPLKTRSGVLLFGPSGCGKTYVMSTIVSAENLHCIAVQGPEVFGKYIGQSEQKIREIFEKAQAAAPCVIFFDEFDSVAPQRGQDNTGVTDRVVNQLLCYLDGVEARKDVFVVAASSRPDLIDAALLRPGRLDKIVYCPLPNAQDRVEILRAHAAKVPCHLTDDDLQEIARRCDGWTGADLSGLVATASMAVMQRSVDLTRELRAMNIGAGRDDAKDIPQTYENFVVLSNGSAASSKHCKFNPETFASTIGPLMEKSSLKSNEKPVVSVEKVKIEDLVEAMGRTRRSLSDRDIDHQQRMYSKFMQSRKPGGDPLVQPGTRTTLA